jgi:GNAT superfamily N-acetyltransferase
VLEIRAVSFDDPDAQSLIDGAMADLAARYGGTGDDTPVDPADFRAPGGDFLVAYLDGVPVACAGWRSLGTDGTTAELKRMYTRPQARRRGVARAVLRAVEQSARAAGCTRVALETGALQPEAISMYESSGYALIPNFGYYKDEPDVRSFGRVL